LDKVIHIGGRIWREREDKVFAGESKRVGGVGGSKGIHFMPGRIETKRTDEGRILYEQQNKKDKKEK
jgi:hypothetical protein